MSGVLVRRTILFEPGSRRCTGGVAIIGPVVIFFFLFILHPCPPDIDNGAGNAESAFILSATPKLREEIVTVFPALVSNVSHPFTQPFAVVMTQPLNG